ncbi:MAG: hypothetical protein ACKV2O_23500 [Acidimicrobiales bacterium]
MQLDRISYQYPDDTTAAYDLHGRLTVIDVHPAHRRALVEHLLAALWSDSPGVHVEFTTGEGRALVAFRPYRAAARVIDLGDRSDQTQRYQTPTGAVDVLRPIGVDARTALAQLLADRTDLGQIDPTEGWMSRLLAHDPDLVADTAEQLVNAERAIRDATRVLTITAGNASPGAGSVAATADGSPAGSPTATPEFAETVSRVYDNRDRVTSLERRHVRIRLATLVVGIAVPVAAVVGLSALGGTTAAGIIALSALVAAVCLFLERRLDRAVAAEYRVLEEAGAGSYEELDARLANSPLADPVAREQLITSAQRYRDLTVSWQRLAGAIPAAWVATQRERLAEMAALRSALEPVPIPLRGSDTSAAALLAGLIARSEAIRTLSGGEALPLFLDDPLAGLVWEEKVPVLEFLNRLAESQQLVLCTDDVEVLAWARLEMMAGNAAVLDVNPGRKLAGAEATG